MQKWGKVVRGGGATIPHSGDKKGETWDRRGAGKTKMRRKMGGVGAHGGSFWGTV